MSETQWQTLHRLVSCLESKRIELHPENALETFLVTSIIPDESSRHKIKLSDGADIVYLHRFEAWFKKGWDGFDGVRLVCKLFPDISFLNTECEWKYRYERVNKKGHQFFPPDYRDITKPNAPMLPLDTLGSKVWFTNYIVKQAHRAYSNSHFSDKISTIDPDTNWGVHVPDGLRVFWPLQLDRDEEINKKLFNDAEHQITKMFLAERHQASPWISMDTTTQENQNDRQKKLLFYTQRRDPRAPSLTQADQLRPDSIKGYFEQPTFKRVLAMIEGDYPELALFILMHGKAIQNLLQCTDGDLENCSLMLLEYGPNVGFRPHIDGISSFGDEFGPIFTINMYQSHKSTSRSYAEKLYDMFPVLNDLGMKPIRVKSLSGEIIMTQGTARALYSHSIPEDHPARRATIAFKFGHVSTRLPISQTHSFMLDADIPSIDVNLFYGVGENQAKGENRDRLFKTQHQDRLKALVPFQEAKKRDFLRYGPNPRELTREEEAEVETQKQVDPDKYEPRPPVHFPVGYSHPKAHTAVSEESPYPEEADVTEEQLPGPAGFKRGRGGGGAGPSAARDLTTTVIEVGDFFGVGPATLGFVDLKSRGDPFLDEAKKRVGRR